MMLGTILIAMTCWLTTETETRPCDTGPSECTVWKESAVDAITDMFHKDTALGAVYLLECAPLDELVTEVLYSRLPAILGRSLTLDEMGELEETLIW